MTRRDRRTYFDRLCGLREAYQHLDASDRTGIVSIADAIAAAELELEQIAAEAETSSPPDHASSTPHQA